MALSATTDRKVSTNSADATPPFGQEQGRIDREAFGLRRALKTGLLVLLLALIVMGGLYYRFSQRTTREIQRNYAALAALSRISKN